MVSASNVQGWVVVVSKGMDNVMQSLLHVALFVTTKFVAICSCGMPLQPPGVVLLPLSRKGCVQQSIVDSRNVPMT
eukprot:844007-Amphidinium_carterae.1